MKKHIIYITLLLGINFSIFAQSTEKKWVVSGYIKDLQSALILPASQLVPVDLFINDNLLHHRLNFKYFLSDDLTFKTDLRTRVFWGDQIKLSHSHYIEQLDEANDYFDLSYGVADSLGIAFHTMIDRLYFDYTSGNWQLRVGRQRLNWGISTVWNPNDIFNAYSFTDFDYEERPGSDAILVKYYINFASSIELAVKAFDKKEDAVGAILFKWNKWTYDFQLLSGIMKNNLVLGGGWAGNFFDAGFKGELSWFKAIDEDEEDGFALTLGFDYIFKNGLYTNLGFLYNKNGTDNQSLSNIFSFELSAKNLYPYKTALFAQLSYPFNPLLNGGIAIIYSPVDTHPVFISPSLSYSLSSDLDFGLFGQLILEKNDTFESPVQAFYIRFKYSY